MNQTWRQTLWGLVLMGTASLAILFAAWLTVPVPVVKDSVQTELLSVHVYRDGAYQSWCPEDMVQRQTARAITDHMARCREKNTLRRARVALEEAPEIQLYFRTEDAYRVVCLGGSEDAAFGWSARQDRTGPAARICDPDRLSDYIMEQIGGDLPPEDR